jgi:hypothetical protein
MMVKPLWARTSASSPGRSSGEIVVPVGLPGEATSTPRVAGPQCSRTSRADNWKRFLAVVGTSLGRPLAATMKLQLAG